MEGLLGEVVARIKPKQKPEAVAATLQKINKLLSARKLKAKAHLGGSFAKDTWLAGDHDVDIFVAFDKHYADDGLSDMLGKALALLKPERVHGSRDYFRIKHDFNYEIIPVVAIRKDSDARNITDYSLRHVEWVNKHGKGLKDDIRLAKKFCKAQQVYGAESYIRGFSGHVLDLMVINYGGFSKLMRAASKWKPKTVIDIGNEHKGMALMDLNKSKTEGPLIVVDPVQPDRNAAASLTLENYSRFVKAAQEYLRKPLIAFFEKKRLDLDALARKGSVATVSATATKASDDVAGTRLMKLYEHCRARLKDAGFTLIDSGWNWDGKALMWFVTKEKELPSSITVQGPPVSMKPHCAAFKKKHGKVFESKGRMFAEMMRELRTPLEVLKAAVKDDNVKDKASQVAVSVWR